MPSILRAIFVAFGFSVCLHSVSPTTFIVTNSKITVWPASNWTVNQHLFATPTGAVVLDSYRGGYFYNYYTDQRTVQANCEKLLNKYDPGYTPSYHTSSELDLGYRKESALRELFKITNDYFFIEECLAFVRQEEGFEKTTTFYESELETYFPGQVSLSCGPYSVSGVDLIIKGKLMGRAYTDNLGSDLAPLRSGCKGGRRCSFYWSNNGTCSPFQVIGTGEWIQAAIDAQLVTANGNTLSSSDVKFVNSLSGMVSYVAINDKLGLAFVNQIISLMRDESGSVLTKLTTLGQLLSDATEGKVTITYVPEFTVEQKLAILDLVSKKGLVYGGLITSFAISSLIALAFIIGASAACCCDLLASTMAKSAWKYPPPYSVRASNDASTGNVSVGKGSSADFYNS